MKAIFGTARAMLWAGCKSDDSTLTLQKAGDLVGQFIRAGGTVDDVLGKCFEAAIDQGAIGSPKSEEEEGEEGEKAALQLINERPGATAIIAANDLVAIGAANVLIDQGLKIPDDISLVGFGDILNAENYRVPLTTISQPKYRRGIASMDTMINLLKGKSGGSKRLTAELIIRESTGKPI